MSARFNITDAAENARTAVGEVSEELKIKASGVISTKSVNGLKNKLDEVGEKITALEEIADAELDEAAGETQTEKDRADEAEEELRVNGLTGEANAIYVKKDRTCPYCQTVLKAKTFAMECGGQIVCHNCVTPKLRPVQHA